ETVGWSTRSGTSAERPMRCSPGSETTSESASDVKRISRMGRATGAVGVCCSAAFGGSAALAPGGPLGAAAFGAAAGAGFADVGAAAGFAGVGTAAGFAGAGAAAGFAGAGAGAVAFAGAGAA